MKYDCSYQKICIEAFPERSKITASRSVLRQELSPASTLISQSHIMSYTRAPMDHQHQLIPIGLPCPSACVSSRQTLCPVYRPAEEECAVLPPDQVNLEKSFRLSHTRASYALGTDRKC